MDVVAKLVIAGANVQRCSRGGLSAGHLAARSGRLAVLDKLLAAGYLVDMPTDASQGAQLSPRVSHACLHNELRDLCHFCICLLVSMGVTAGSWGRIDMPSMQVHLCGCPLLCCFFS